MNRTDVEIYYIYLMHILAGNPGNGDWVPPPKVNEEQYNAQFTEDRLERSKFETDLDYIFAEKRNPIKVKLILSRNVFFQIHTGTVVYGVRVILIDVKNRTS